MHGKDRIIRQQETINNLATSRDQLMGKGRGITEGVNRLRRMEIENREIVGRIQGRIATLRTKCLPTTDVNDPCPGEITGRGIRIFLLIRLDTPQISICCNQNSKTGAQKLI